MTEWYDDSRAGKREKQQRYEDLRGALFRDLDRDGSRVVSRAEFVRALTSMRSIWKETTAEGANRLFDDITAGFGSVTLAKLDGFLVRTAVQKAIRKYRAAKDEKRGITREAFVSFLVNEGATEKHAAHVWRAVDENRNGLVSLAEFRDYFADMLKADTLVDVF